VKPLQLGAEAARARRGGSLESRFCFLFSALARWSLFVRLWRRWRQLLIGFDWR